MTLVAQAPNLLLKGFGSLRSKDVFLSMKEYGKSAVELYFLAVGNRPLRTAATPFLK